MIHKPLFPAEFLPIASGLFLNIQIIGDLHISTYDFDPGGVLPMHKHGPGFSPNHITIVLAGPFDIYGSDGQVGCLLTGEVVDWIEGDPHEFAYRGDTHGRIVNIRHKLGETPQTQEDLRDLLAKVGAANAAGDGIRSVP